MRDSDGLANAQSESAADRFTETTARSIGAKKPVEHARQILRRDADPRVGHRQNRDIFVWLAKYFDDDAAARGCVFDRVIKQVVHQLPQ
jgi:hypothetical protein